MGCYSPLEAAARLLLGFARRSVGEGGETVGLLAFLGLNADVVSRWDGRAGSFFGSRPPGETAPEAEDPPDPPVPGTQDPQEPPVPGTRMSPCERQSGPRRSPSVPRFPVEGLSAEMEE
ncbi:hypothetical protein chiPu_0008181 [Chiloscyllium punctatum]|uniref:Uncharacterized protein n=1 Tax=Chiloscyllium punctatum TaxID=137246 RepID=A0A401SH47_CHIPU|nr:hypothetical protein [Chiloscyllium punctatum]